jgi:hypothetical protein
MSDLRDRIAAVLASVEVVLDGDTLNDTSTWLLADAVIAELGLRKQSQTGEIVNLIEGDCINYGRHRYVTEWTTDGVNQGT